ncbi:MAG: hypothetical protein K2N15_07035 [Lachnospiraceae bacterium]|nr:hypothetical protein [Lachnospiraceae bacterium]
MEWDTYWNTLLDNKKLRSKVSELNQADALLGNEIGIEEICRQIFEDYVEWRKDLEKIKQGFLEIIEGFKGVHLQCNRIKSIDSLLAKVITKRHANLKNNESDYARINGNNYKYIITDLIGMRLIINYRGKWVDIHEEILGAFPYGNKDDYISGKLLPHLADGSGLQAEIPKVYHAEGDDVLQYEKYGLDVKLHDKGYRSIHYTVSYKETYIEIQVRTIYDEAWSDCDHNYVYKHDENKSHTALAQMSEILCKLTNVSSDIGENMKDIFEEQTYLELEKKKWKTSLKNQQALDKSLEIIKKIQDDLTSFRNRLVVGE